VRENTKGGTALKVRGRNEEREDGFNEKKPMRRGSAGKGSRRKGAEEMESESRTGDDRQQQSCDVVTGSERETDGDG